MLRFFLLLLVSVLIPLCAQAQESCKEPRLRISHLRGPVYVYTTWKQLGDTRFPSNSMYLVHGDEAMLVDMPWDTTQLQPLFDSIRIKHGARVTRALFTHFHDDRTAGMGIVASAGVSTFATETTARYCEEEGSGQPTSVFSGDTLFRFGMDTMVTYFPGAGHSPDNIVVWLPGYRILFGGCLVKSVENTGAGNLADADIIQWPQSLRNVQKKFPDAEFVVPGHYRWSGPEALTHSIRIIEAERLKK